MMLWVPTLAICLDMTGATAARAVALACLCLVLAQQSWFYYFASTWGMQRTAATLAIMADQSDLEALRPTYPVPEHLGGRVEILRQQGLSIYYR